MIMMSMTCPCDIPVTSKSIYEVKVVVLITFLPACSVGGDFFIKD